MNWLWENWFMVVMMVIVAMMVILLVGLAFFCRIPVKVLDREANIDPGAGRSEYHEHIMDPRGKLSLSRTDLYR